MRICTQEDIVALAPNLTSGPTETARHGGWPNTHSRPGLRTWAAGRWPALVMGPLLAIPGPALAGFDAGIAVFKGGNYRAAYLNPEQIL